MKLIIDIPEDRYKDVIESQKHHLLDSYAQAVANGIPLEQIGDEIRQEILNFKEKCNASDYLGCGILEIIDKYR